jgi:hypothetical protein
MKLPVEPATPAKVRKLTTAERQLEAVSADLELIGVAFMEGQPPGSCYTPEEIATWVSAHRRREMEVINNPVYDAESGPLVGMSVLNQKSGSMLGHLFEEPPAVPYCQLCGAGRLHAIHSPDARRAKK